MRVKILSTPTEKLQVPQIKPFNSPYDMPTPFMAYGGALPGMGKDHNGMDIRSTDMKWDWLRTPDGVGAQAGPFSSVGRTLPESDNPDLVVEKNETIMGNYNGDGMPVLMHTPGGTGSHASGNDFPTTAPSDAFVFSDTRSLKVKDPEILKMFGASKPSTPADLSSRIDLVKYKAVLDNKDADELAKKTNQYNYVNGVNKLNQLATVQEGMKDKMGISDKYKPWSYHDVDQKEAQRLKGMGYEFKVIG